ncbi:hypothetical protein QMM98_17195 [Leptospira santarosai]|nr:hypothetical protein [Leptospira santarosai]MDI7223071.1 hypothetical protein [Leptospira santarosai]
MKRKSIDFSRTRPVALTFTDYLSSSVVDKSSSDYIVSVGSTFNCIDFTTHSVCVGAGHEVGVSRSGRECCLCRKWKTCIVAVIGSCPTSVIRVGTTTDQSSKIIIFKSAFVSVWIRSCGRNSERRPISDLMCSRKRNTSSKLCLLNYKLIQFIVIRVGCPTSRTGTCIFFQSLVPVIVVVILGCVRSHRTESASCVDKMAPLLGLKSVG